MGRIVLPIEVRKKLKLAEGNMLEISVLEDGVILKKIEPLKDLKMYIEQICSILKNCNVICVSESSIVYTSREFKAFEGKCFNDSVIGYIVENNNQKINNLYFCDGLEIKNKFCYFYKLAVYGDIRGYIFFFCDGKVEQKLEGVMEFIADYIKSKL